MCKNCQIDAGFYTFHDQFSSEQSPKTGYGSLEVFELETGTETEPQTKPGWYWQSRWEGFKPDALPVGPFETARLALADASPDHPSLKGKH